MTGKMTTFTHYESLKLVPLLKEHLKKKKKKKKEHLINVAVYFLWYKFHFYSALYKYWLIRDIHYSTISYKDLVK